MNFFQELSKIMGTGKITLTIQFEENSQIITSFLPDLAKDVAPVVISGPAEEMDKEWMGHIHSAMKTNADVIANVQMFSKSLKAAEKAAATEKGKATPAKTPAATPTGSKKTVAATTTNNKAGGNKKATPVKSKSSKLADNPDELADEDLNKKKDPIHEAELEETLITEETQEPVEEEVHPVTDEVPEQQPDLEPEEEPVQPPPTPTVSSQPQLF
jgi:PRTRC genetic system protein E